MPLKGGNTMTIEQIINKKQVLLIPIISMRSYETGLYNLMSDGNVSRIISKLACSDFKKATVLVPQNNCGLYELQKLADRVIGKDKVDFVECDAYGKNAGETRVEIKKFMKYLSDDYDVILIEPNLLTEFLIKQNSPIVSKLVYWCPVSATTGFTPQFIEGFADIDKFIAQNIPVAVATKSQKDFLMGKSFIDKSFYNPEPFDYKTIYFPFRLSDPCYHAKEFKQAILNLKDKGYNFKVLYSDPNESGLFDDDNIFVKVPTQKEVYTQILKSKPIIPYLENSNDVLHISICEFIYYQCEVIQFENEIINNPCCENIHDISELESALEKKLKTNVYKSK